MTVQIAFTCPRCGYKSDAVSAIGPGSIAADPEAGDVSICLFCGAPLELAEGAPPRWLSYDEFGRLPVGIKVQCVQAMIAIVTMRPSRVRVIPR
jgi:hypothetical protein